MALPTCSTSSGWGFTFKHFPFDPERATVTYHSGRGVRRRLGEAGEHVAQCTKNTLSQSEFFQSCKETVVNTGDLALGITQATCSLGSQTLNAANSVFDVLPGVAPLRSSKQNRAEASRAAQIKKADLRQRKQETPFVPTIR